MEIDKVSVLILSYKRFKNLERILKAWLEQPEVDEVILWDNSGKFKTDLPIVVINSQVNFNLGVRYNIAAMAKNDIIINADDDTMPHQELIKDMLKYLQPDRLLGVRGVIFHGSYSQNGESFNGEKIKEPVRVDLAVGYLTMTNKKNLLGIDYSKFSVYNAEFELAIRSPDLQQYVIPTDKYSQLKESWDENALFLMPEADAVKEELYKRYVESRRSSSHN